MLIAPCSGEVSKQRRRDPALREAISSKHETASFLAVTWLIIPYLVIRSSLYESRHAGWKHISNKGKEMIVHRW